MVDKDSRGRLLEAGTELFANKGFAAVSIRELAQAAQVNSALINYHFGGKDGLYVAILENTFGQIQNGFQKALSPEISPLARLQFFVDNLVRIHQENPFLKRLMNSELCNPTIHFENIIKKRVAQFYQMGQETIAAASAAGELRSDLNPAFIAIALAGMINFYFLAQPVVDILVPPYPEREQEFVDNARKIFLNGLLPPNKA